VYIVASIIPEPVPLEENVQGFEPCDETRVIPEPGSHVIVAPVGRLFIENAVPNEQTEEGPEMIVPVSTMLTVTALVDTFD
jgi:hypothetical protein